MAATATTGFPVPATVPVLPLAPSVARRRRISPRDGRALEILGHAIEYLADEFVHEGACLTSGNPQVQAIQLLVALNRQVYFDCPPVPDFGERCRAFFRQLAAS